MIIILSFIILGISNSDKAELISPEVDLDEYFDVLNDLEDTPEFLTKLIVALLGVKSIFKPSEYCFDDSKLNIKYDLTFCREENCTATMTNLQHREFEKCSNFSLYNCCSRNANFKTLVLQTTLNICIFIGLQFPNCVSSVEELFELFHAVIYKFI